MGKARCVDVPCGRYQVIDCINLCCSVKAPGVSRLYEFNNIRKLTIVKILLFFLGKYMNIVGVISWIG